MPPVTPSEQQEAHLAGVIEWGIDKIKAPQVWNSFNIRGEGIVVANIDSGVQFDHPALVRQYRGRMANGTFNHNYNWFDPSKICGDPSAVPCDNDGHGTHTMGTMVGDDGAGNQIGVAPAARWIAAKGCEARGCTDAALLASGQWMLAPTDLNGRNARADLRPHIVNSSWGDAAGSNTFFRDTVNAWIASGIFPVFSNGNSGPGCRTAGSPGDYAESYSVGAFNSFDEIARFSSRGNSRLTGGIKPNISAPGVEIRSAVPDNNYAAYDGTSMAAPHVAGAIALLWSGSSSLIGDIAGTRSRLDQTAIDVNDTNCGGTATNNNVWGQGKLDIFAAVSRSTRDQKGTISATDIALALVVLHQGDIRRAIDLQEEALAIHRELGYSIGIALSLSNLTTMLEYQGNYERSAHVATECLNCYRDLQDSRGIGWALHALAVLHHRRGRHAEARAQLEECRALFRRVNAKTDLVGVLNDLGDVACALGEYAEAQALYDESLALATELGDRRCEAAALHNLGRLGCAVGDYDGATERYNASLALHRELGDQRGIALVLESEGRLAQQQERYERAATLLRESLARMEVVGDQAAIARCHEALATIGSYAGSAPDSVNYS